jgi:hypothetical protein
MKNKIQTMLLSALVAGLAVCGASARPVTCGAVLTSDITLRSDLACSGSGAALVVGAANITVDLNGHTLTGDGTGVGIDNSGGFAHVTIKNGAIAGFGEGIRSVGAGQLKLSGLAVAGCGFNIYLADGEGVEIKDVVVSGESASTYGVLCESVGNVAIKETTINGCQIGIEFGSCGLGPSCPPQEDQPPTTGSIKGSAIADCFIGIGLPNTDNCTVEESVVSGCVQGIRVGVVGLSVRNVRIMGNDISGNRPFGIVAQANPLVAGTLPLPLFNLEIKENYIHDNVRGAVLVNVQDSQVSGNQIGNNLQFGLALFETSSGNHVADNVVTGNTLYGILLAPAFIPIDAPRPGPTGNRLTGNIATGNGAFDLFHSATSTPNVWRDNIYNTKSGADIP